VSSNCGTILSYAGLPDEGLKPQDPIRKSEYLVFNKVQYTVFFIYSSTGPHIYGPARMGAVPRR
jgi:hypothetical protein